MLYNIIDKIYIGHMPNDARLALTGVGVCLPLLMTFGAIENKIEYNVGTLFAELTLGMNAFITAEASLRLVC